MTIAAFSLARRLRNGETVFTGWCGLPAPLVAETIAREGFPAVTIDMQHGLWDVAGVVAAIAAIRLAEVAPVVRIPLGEMASASRALDFCAEGIIAPMINTVAQARAFVAATKFPPLGERSWGPHRAMALAGIADQMVYLRTANAATVTFAMIETGEALANVEAIMDVPGIDAAFVGPSDLSIALSKGAVLDPHSSEVEAGVDRIAAAALGAGKIAGAYCATPERAHELARRGYRFLAIGSDLGFLRAGTAAVVSRLKA